MNNLSNSLNKFRSEKELFFHVWQTRSQRSFVSGTPLEYEPVASNFAHVLPKNRAKYPNFKLYEKNIVLLTPQEHEIWDRRRGSIDLTKYPMWKKLIDLERELKIEYQQAFGKYRKR